MAHTSSNCLYFDQHNTESTKRVYEFTEVDEETRQKDCKICMYSLGLICNVVVFALIHFTDILTDIQSNHWSSIARYTCYFILFILSSLFIRGIAKILNFRKSINTNHNSQKDDSEI